MITPFRSDHVGEPEGWRGGSQALRRPTRPPTLRSRPDRVLVGIAALTALVTIAGIRQGCAGAGHADPEASGAAVEVEAVALDSALAGTLVLPGRIKARQEVVVSARLAGRVTALLAREGDRVRAGQPLARFDAPEARRALGAAHREFDSATLSAEVARRQQARIESLYVARVAAQREFELAGSERRSAEARLEAARAALENLQAALDVSAPFDGVVARRGVDPGADVQPGTPLFVVRSAGGTEIVVPVPEAAVAALPRARFAFQVGEGEWRPATLARLEGMTDFTTRTRTAHLVPVGDLTPEPGAFARVRLESADLPDPRPPLLPLTSVVRRGALTGGYVVEGDRAVLRWLKLGREEGGSVEVLSGLFPGERVVRSAAGLADGSRVKVRS